MSRFVIHVLFAAVLLSGGMLTPARATDAEDQQAVAKKFLTAYFQMNMPKVRECLPARRESMFMAYPLTSAPTLATPKVHKKQALVDFTATTGDKKFPGKGGVVLYRENDVWKVRQVLFYDTVPALFGLPNKSVTADDRAQEAKVKAVATTFLAAWKAGNSKTMRANWYDWTVRNDKRVAGLTITDFKLSNSTTTWKDPYVAYTMKVTYKLGVLPLTMEMKGGLVMVKDGKAWKVRANHFIFDF